MQSNLAPNLSTALCEENYARWRSDPLSVDPSWASFFEGFELGCSYRANGEAPLAMVAEKTAQPQKHRDLAAEHKFQTKVDSLIFSYRYLGHTIAKLDPLGSPRPPQPVLELSTRGLAESDLNRKVSSPFYMNGQEMTLRELHQSLKETYCGPIGAELRHIHDKEVRDWLLGRFENWREICKNYTVDSQVGILNTLLKAELFESFLHTKLVGQKRFSLEGGEALMVALESILHRCPASHVSEIVMGMAHRGRLTVLANFLQKRYSKIFFEFSENYVTDSVYGSGDVKYHQGYCFERIVGDGTPIRITLSSNPSHLEAVDPVMQGIARARQRICEDTATRQKVLPLLIHGDGAFAGQGIVAEVFNFSQLPGYRTGGTVHIVINNQIGFTTLPDDARSSVYCTDVAKMIEAPIFHVNGENPLAVDFVSSLAFEFRQRFSRDVIIDMYCFRKHGHNESDEPMFTQPTLWSKINKHPSVGQLFKNQLLQEGKISEKNLEQMAQSIHERLEEAFQEAKIIDDSTGNHCALEHDDNAPEAHEQNNYSHDKAHTAISKECLEKVATGLFRHPEGFEFLPKVKRLILEQRREIYENGAPYNWGYAEALAIGSLLVEGTPVRLSGQDSRRGTFSHRHAALYDVNTRERYFPLKNLSEDQATFCVYNSPLSEASVLGFDYGYSLAFPQMLCIWEAQFGDFANGAQVIVDQFIISAESKWGERSGLVMLLPHGYEGQGPEHSSARLERFLQLCAEDNIQVCNLTTPAQYFHVLRRQMRRTFRKPLVIMAPKSLLRLPEAVSSEQDFTEGSFCEILDDPNTQDPMAVKRIILCSGKVYYDLIKEANQESGEQVAIIRIEQLYPLHTEMLSQILSRYANAETFVWCQEEHQNMGAWNYIEPELRKQLNGRNIIYAGRKRRASTAAGTLARHKTELSKFLHAAFTKTK